MKKNETKAVCPNCGTEFELPAYEQHVSGTCIAKNSGLGTIYLKPAGQQTAAQGVPVGIAQTKQQKRLQKLAAAGIDTSAYFSVVGASGKSVTMRMDGDVPVVVTDSELDEIEKSIREDGYVKNTRLYRRWVMAQMFHHLNFVSYDGKKSGYMDSLNWHHCYIYQWTTLEDELRTLSVLERKDAECFNERRRWFTKDVVIEMFKDYKDKLRAEISKMSKRKCKGVPYVRYHGKDTFLYDLEEVYYAPIVKAIHHITVTKNYTEMYNVVAKFRKEHGFYNLRASFCPAWVDAFKGEGAFYTMKNLILFHGCNVYLHGVYNEKLYNHYNTEESFAVLNSKADEYAKKDKNGKTQGWKLFGFMKQLIEDNNFDYTSRMIELGVYKK